MDAKSDLERDVELSKEMRAGGDHYRAYVGPPKQFDFMGATQFALLFMLGIREEHHVLDVGCGSLRAGRLLLQFLLPGRYCGVEPNAWLWKDAVSAEIGEDLLKLKNPVFYEDDSFSLKQIDRGFDFIVLQSVLSHTGGDQIDRPLIEARKTLKPQGQLLFTVLDEAVPDGGRFVRGDDAPGWHYPECVTYDQVGIEARCHNAGLYVQRLNWYHPRQSWYRAVLDERYALSPEAEAQMGTGRPLFDDRFR